MNNEAKLPYDPLNIRMKDKILKLKLLLHYLLHIRNLRCIIVIDICYNEILLNQEKNSRNGLKK
jgi:hypothetical protein